MAQTDESIALNAESPLKRKAISECRLQDPKIWTKISWIRTNFIEDLNSGVRKTDFYNFVTERLGKTGYRDVWHLLKIAYPHVDRVRRGRKYMYWGIRHADGHVEFEDTDDGSHGQEVPLASPAGVLNYDETSPKEINHGSMFDVREYKTDNSMEVDDENTSAKDGESLQTELTLKPLSNSRMPSKKSLEGIELPHIRDIQSGVVVKQENECKDDVVVMEFKEREVFASFEDYEKSKQTDQNSNVVDATAKNTPANRKPKRVEIEKAKSMGSNSRSVSPPLEIFSFDSFDIGEKDNQVLNLSTTSTDLHDNLEPKSTQPQKSLKQQDGFHGNFDSVDGTPVSGDQENNDAPAHSDKVLRKNSVTTLGQDYREGFIPNLLEPENINRICMPLIKDLGKKISKKIKRSKPHSESSASDNVANSQLSDTKDVSEPTRLPSPCNSVENSKTDIEMKKNERLPCDPFIVSVASIAGLQDDKYSNKSSSSEMNDVLKTLHLHQSKNITAQLGVSIIDGNADSGASSPKQSPSSQFQNAIESDTQFVVVQDRGTQVSERLHNCNPLRKGCVKQAKFTVCHKPCHSSKNDHTLKSSSQAPSNNIALNMNHGCLTTKSATVNKEGQLLVQANKARNASNSVQNDALVWSSRASPSNALLNERVSITRSGVNDGSAQPRFSTNIQRNSLPAPTILNVTSGQRSSNLQTANTFKNRLETNAPRYRAPVMKNRSPVNGSRGTAPQLQSTVYKPSSNAMNSAINAINQSHAQARGQISRPSANTTLLSSADSSSERIVGTTSNVQECHPNTMRHSQREKQNHLDNISSVNTISTGQLLMENERHDREAFVVNESTLRNREFLRKLLSDHETKNSATYSSTSDLQVMVDCLSSELEKERTMRLRLEMELRKVENQLNEERKLNERLASLLMKR